MTEKPEPDEDDKKKASEMMDAYKEKPTIVLPGTGGSVSGTAVNEWLDEDGNPRHEEPEGSDARDSDAQDSDAQDSDAQEKGDGQRDEEALKEQIEKDKALNEKLREAAQEENKGEKGKKGEKGEKG
ncbi:hypothetical protein A5760_09105 [Mycobacterium colombiense]|uniref:Uncharacterized protein n=1 Tax=Mycobacterium colombiense TaxID=339268 RepID=A0A1A0VP45_9MYCO|nr:hypothetical protein [Mycobacterium colombiense]OBB85032.1 hypothetical protein A5760_09105 [Mycobacterium colombiense]